MIVEHRINNEQNANFARFLAFLFYDMHVKKNEVEIKVRPLHDY